jgi:2,5-diamino-6-(ribosylamino)-4(3H)-pyrimidinone 5'-phosphate reductase
VKKKTERPYVICHMTTSVDGKIKPRLWPKKTNIHSLYEQCHKKLKGDGWIIGRTSMEGYSSKKIKTLPNPDKSIGKKDFIGDENASSFAIVVDQSGRCRWDSNSITGDHIIEILTEKVSIAYLTHLRERRVSYIFAGKAKVDLRTALRKLKKLFGIERLLLEGGGIINGSFLADGLIDEVSQLIMPLVDGSINTPTIFDVEVGYTRRKASHLKLKAFKRLPGDVVWLRFTVQKER